MVCTTQTIQLTITLLGRVGVMKVLLENGADVNNKNKKGATPFHCAAQAGDVEALELLLNWNVDQSATTIYNAT